MLFSAPVQVQTDIFGEELPSLLEAAAGILPQRESSRSGEADSEEKCFNTAVNIMRLNDQIRDKSFNRWLVNNLHTYVNVLDIAYPKAPHHVEWWKMSDRSYRLFWY